MAIQKPLPLLKLRDVKSKYAATPQDLKTGIILLLVVWSVFLVSMASLLGFIGIPNPIATDFPVENYYTLAVLLIPVLVWVWGALSWTAIKMFKHASGIGGLVDGKD